MLQLHQPRWLGALPTHVDLAGLNGGLGQATRLEEARGPKPDVETDGEGFGHWGMMAWDEAIIRDHCIAPI